MRYVLIAALTAGVFAPAVAAADRAQLPRAHVRYVTEMHVWEPLGYTIVRCGPRACRIRAADACSWIGDDAATRDCAYVSYRVDVVRWPGHRRGYCAWDGRWRELTCTVVPPPVIELEMLREVEG